MPTQATDAPDFHSLANAAIADLKPYIPGKPIEELERELGITDIIKLASNENPLGPSPKALEAIQAASGDLALYPDGSGFALTQSLAEHLDVAPERITLGNGSNDVLVLLAQTFLSGGHEAVFSQYSFAVYPIATQAAGGRAQMAPALPEDHGQMPLGHDLEAMAGLIGGKTRLVFLANPNNPTGTWLPADNVKDFIGQVPRHVLVVVDEAYFEYSREHGTGNALDWIDEYPNLVVTRTFSKAYGLAGLRVGFSVSHPDVANLLGRVRQPFNVNSLAQVAARVALKDQDHVARAVATNQTQRDRLARACDDLGLNYCPSAGNFLLVDLGREATPVVDALLRRGIITRPVANYGLPRHVRISLGTKEETTRLLNALPKALKT